MGKIFFDDISQSRNKKYLLLSITMPYKAKSYFYDPVILFGLIQVSLIAPTSIKQDMIVQSATTCTLQPFVKNIYKDVFCSFPFQEVSFQYFVSL